MATQTLKGKSKATRFSAFSVILLFFLFAFNLTSFTQDRKAPPAFIMEQWEQQIGTWIADNSEYKSEHEPYEAYGLAWEWGIGKKSIMGKLFVIADGENKGTPWQYRQYWHPGKQKAYIIQFGSDGTYGEGELEILENGETKLLQTFYSPDGNTWQTGHKSTTTEKVHASVSYRIENSKWIENRTYEWKKEAEQVKR